MATLAFRTVSQAILFEHELKGQISDGQWENLNRRDHWKPWCNCEVVVREPVGRDFPANYDGYNFSSKSLLEVVGDRMISFARIGLTFGRDSVKVLKNLLDLDGNYRGMPTYTGEYWDETRTAIQTWLYDNNQTLDAVKRAVEMDEFAADHKYDKKRLLADLREMKQTIKTMTEPAELIDRKPVELTKAEPLGTEWVCPGSGSTVREVRVALEQVGSGLQKHYGHTVSLECAVGQLHGQALDERTNLRLTGAPLQAYDLERIAACDVR